MTSKRTFFTSDLHLGHKNILKYDNRPFDTIEEHDRVILKNWNSIVKPDDDVYYLGDLCMGNINIARNFLYGANGNKFFIKGNHDGSKIIDLYKFHGIYLGNMEEIKIEDQLITLCHYAMRVYNKSHKGAWQLYGHSHHSLPDDPNSLSLDVGINGYEYNYHPVSFEKIKQLMGKKTWKAIDHHGE